MEFHTVVSGAMEDLCHESEFEYCFQYIFGDVQLFFAGSMSRNKVFLDDSVFTGVSVIYVPWVILSILGSRTQLCQSNQE